MDELFEIRKRVPEQLPQAPIVRSVLDGKLELEGYKRHGLDRDEANRFPARATLVQGNPGDRIIRQGEMGRRTGCACGSPRSLRSRPRFC